MSAEKGESANRLMKKIISMKLKYGLSILVLSHTPKRDLSSPITQNTLAGSKTQMNFFNGFLHFEEIGYSTERDHLKQQSENDAAAMTEKVVKMVSDGKSYRDIAGELGLSPSGVCRIVKKSKS